jgi:hypothetical protein
MDFFKDPGNWSVIVAALALILSQLPPIRDLIKGTEINISIPEQISLWHFLGNFQIAMLVDVANVGGTRVAIRKLECLLIDANDKIWLLPAQAYISRQPPSQPHSASPEYLMTRISLKPSDNWSETVRFYRLWTESEEEETNDILSSIKSSIQSQLPSEKLVEANPLLVERAVSFFKRKFDLHKGNYKLVIVAKNQEDKVIALSGFEMTMFENHVRALVLHADQYKFGAGIYYPINNPDLSAWVRVRPMSNKKEVKEIYNRFKPK